MKFTFEKILFCSAVISIPFDIVFHVGIVRLTTTEILFSLAMLFWCVQCFMQRREIILTPSIIPMLVFVGACLLSGAYASQKIVVVRETVQFLWMFCLFIFLINQSYDKEMFGVIVSLLMIAGVVVSLFGVYQYFIVREPVDFLISQSRLRAFGFYDQPNTLGNFLAGIIPLGIGFHVISLSKCNDKNVSQYFSWGNSTILLTVLFILSFALVVTFSRGSWAGLFFGMVCFCLAMRKYLRFASLQMPLLFAMIAIVIAVVDISSQDDTINRSFSNRQRILLAGTAIAMFRDHPITGVGSGNFQYCLPEYSTAELDTMLRQSYDEVRKTWYFDPGKKPDTELAHNVVLQVAAETGAVGIISFCLLFGVFFLQAWQQLKDSTMETEGIIRSTCLTSVVALLGAGMFGWPFSHGIQELLMVTMAFSTSSKMQGKSCVEII